MPASPPSLRLFLALWPDAAALDALVEWQSRCRWPDAARPTPRDHLHVTLHFLGQVPSERLPDLVRRLATPAAASGPFALPLDRASTWHGGIAVVEPSSAPPALVDWHVRLAGLLEAAGLPIESRPYRPHVTLARHAGGATLGEPPSVPIRWTVDRFTLVSSAGGRYTSLARFL
jgi:2'-5' RNA ligase